MLEISSRLDNNLGSCVPNQEGCKVYNAERKAYPAAVRNASSRGILRSHKLCSIYTIIVAQPLHLQWR